MDFNSPRLFSAPVHIFIILINLILVITASAASAPRLSFDLRNVQRNANVTSSLNNAPAQTTVFVTSTPVGSTVKATTYLTIPYENTTSIIPVETPTGPSSIFSLPSTTTSSSMPSTTTPSVLQNRAPALHVPVTPVVFAAVSLFFGAYLF